MPLLKYLSLESKFNILLLRQKISEILLFEEKILKCEMRAYLISESSNLPIKDGEMRV